MAWVSTCTCGKIRGCTIICTRVGGIYSHTHAQARTRVHAHARTGRRIRVPGTHTECPAWTGIDLAYPIDTSGFSLPLLRPRRHSRSLAVYNFTSGFKTRDAAISRPTMCAPLTRPLFPFSGLCESWIMRQARDCHAEPVTREEKHAPRNGRYFHPNARQSATLVYVLG